MSLDQVRAVADAVLYEGYLLYPYRATSRKNQVRWQFGVLGPPGAADEGVGEEPGMAVRCLLVEDSEAAADRRVPRRLSVRVHLRFLQLQTRTVERYDAQNDSFEPVDALAVGDEHWLSWDEAVEQEVVLGYSSGELRSGAAQEVTVDGHEATEELTTTADGESGTALVGRIVRRRWALRARVNASTTEDEGSTRLEVRVDNITPGQASDTGSSADDSAHDGTPISAKDRAIRTSLIGTHLILEAQGARFVSAIDPPTAVAAAARRCSQRRCWPVLAGERPGREAAGPAGEAVTSPVVLGSPIILYDFPEVAEQSAGSLFDSTEIDEILTLRVMTMTEEEKAEARATDPKAREIIDRCDQMSPESLQQLHGILRNPHAVPPDPTARQIGPTDIRNVDPPTFGEHDVPWWDPAADEAVQPELDSVVIDGVPVSKDSLVRVRPSRRADAQDLFFADQVARVTAVLSDVDGGVHVALVLADDPAADLHEWYGRYWYFAPEELEPLTGRDAEEPPSEPRKESRS